MEKLSVKRAVTLACLLIFVSLLVAAMLHRETGRGLSKDIVPSVQASGGCTLGTLNASYRFIGTRFIENVTTTVHPSALLPGAVVGLATFDGAGNIPSGSFTNVVAGVTLGSNKTFTGIYTIDSPACTGTLTIVISTPGGPISVPHNIVVAPDGSEILAIQTDNEVTATKDFKKQ